ncbi:MAG: DUF3667 domain-containing protein [Bacteroidetes bacterium]|nr:DUF3667 domain-containing protein [Bacteroidota bacterium]
MQNPKYLVKNERMVRRYDLRNLGSSLMDAFNLEYGILATLWSLITRPGKSTKHYLSDGRLKYFSPFRLLILSTALLLILIQSSDMASNFEEGFMMSVEENNQGEAEAKKFEAQKVAHRIALIFQEYFNILLWLYIPIISLFTFLFNRKKNLNYAEHVVFNTYYTSVINLFSVILVPGYFFGYESIMMYIYLILSIGYFIWYYRELFEKSWGRALLDTILASLISFTIYSLGTGFLIGAALASGIIPMN